MSQLMLPYYKSWTKERYLMDGKLHRDRIKYGIKSQRVYQKFQNEKFCPSCRKVKPINEFGLFYLTRTKKRSRRSNCKVCQNICSMLQHKKHPRKHMTIQNKKHDLKRKIKAFALIQDKNECVRCGCTDFRFLEINHKNGSKNEHMLWKSGTGLTRSIVKGWRKTDDLELLCRPCNHIHFLEMKYNEKIPMKVVWENPIEV